MMPSKTYIAMILAASMFAGDHAAAQVPDHKFTVVCNSAGGNIKASFYLASAASSSSAGGAADREYGFFNIRSPGLGISGSDNDSCDIFQTQLEATGSNWNPDYHHFKFTVDCPGGAIIGADHRGYEREYGVFKNSVNSLDSCDVFKKQLEAALTAAAAKAQAAAAKAQAAVDAAQAQAAVDAAQAQAAAEEKRLQDIADAKVREAEIRKAAEVREAEIQRLNVVVTQFANAEAGYGDMGMFGLKAGDESEGVSAGAVAATAVQTATSDNKSTTDSTVVALLAVLVVLAVMNVALQMVPRAGQQVAAPYRDLEGHQNMENMRKTSYYEPRTSVAEI